MEQKIKRFYETIENAIKFMEFDEAYWTKRIKETLVELYELGVADGFAEGYMEGKNDFNN